MKLIRAWIAPFPTQRGTDSGMNTICMRVLEKDDEFKPKLNRIDWIQKAKENGEVHYTFGLLDDESLIILKNVIDDYLKKIQ